MQKNCILYDNKICSGCGECDLCDLDPSKICSNCGKCLDNFDYNGIQIDDLVVEEGGVDTGEDYTGDNWRFKRQDPVDEEEETLFIDDVDGLSEEIEHGHHDDDCDCHKH